MKKLLLKISVLTLLLAGCGEHNKSNVELIGYTDTNEVIYDTELAKFYFSRNDLELYCMQENLRESNDFENKQILKYIYDTKTNPVLITDTLGTIMGEVVFDNKFKHKDTLVRIRNHKSPYAFVNEALGWALIKFSKSGKLRVFDKTSNNFVSSIIVDEVETSWYGGTDIRLLNDSLLFSRLRWIR